MRKTSRFLAISLALLLLAGMLTVATQAASSTENPDYKRPVMTAGKMSKAPTIDGKVSTAEWGTRAFRMTESYLTTQGNGLIWVNNDIIGQPRKAVKVEADVYFGWDDSNFYFAISSTSVNNHSNNIPTAVDMWQEDCLQVQIAKKTDADNMTERFELGFSYSTYRNSAQSTEWFPTKGASGLIVNRDFAVAVTNSQKTTTYEVRIPASKIGLSKYTQGSVIPFSFALHIYEPNDDSGDSVKGCFYEWAQGVVGGDPTGPGPQEGTGVKDITKAAHITLGASSDDKPSVVTTAPTTTKSPTTATPGGNTTATPGGNTTATPGGNTTVKPGGNTTATPGGNTTKAPVTTTTPAPTTTMTTVAEDIATNITADTGVIVEDETVGAALKEATQWEYIDAYSYGVEPDKDYAFNFDVGAVYYIENDVAVGLAPYEKEGVMVYKTPAGVTALYGVKEGLPPETTPVDETTTEPTGEGVTTTTAAQADATTTSGESEGGGSKLWIIIAVVAVLAVGGLVYFLLMKKKQNEEE